MKAHLFTFFFFTISCAFAQNLPVVRYEGTKCALTDAQTFKPLTAYKYEYIDIFQEGLAIATLHSEAGKRLQTYLNDKGQEIILPTANQLFPFVEGRAIFKEKDTFGFLDKLGRVVVPATFTKTFNYREGVALVQDAQKKHFFINLAGEILFQVPEKYHYINEKCQQGLIQVGCMEKDEYERSGYSEKGKYAFLDKTGKVVLEVCAKIPACRYASHFENGTAIVGIVDTLQKYGRNIDYGVIDRQGNLIIPTKYKSIDRKGNHFLVKEYSDTHERDYEGLYTNAGKMVLPCAYKGIFASAKDLRVVTAYRYTQENMRNIEYEKRMEGVMGVVDTLGNIVLQPKFKDLWILPNQDFLAYSPENEKTVSVKEFEELIEKVRKNQDFPNDFKQNIEENLKGLRNAKDSLRALNELKNSLAYFSEIKKPVSAKEFEEMIEKIRKDSNFPSELRQNLKEGLKKLKNAYDSLKAFNELRTFMMYAKKNNLRELDLGTDTEESIHYQLYNFAGKPQGEPRPIHFYDALEANDETTYRSQLFPVLFEKKWALANAENKSITTEWVEAIVSFSTAKIRQEVPMRKGNRYEFMNQTFDGANAFGENQFTGVKKGKKWAFLHISGKESTSYMYDSIAPAWRSFGYENVPGHRNYLDNTHSSEAEIMRSLYLPTHHFLASQNQKWGVVDGFGKIFAPFTNDSIVDIFYNYLIVKRGNKQGIIDYTGKELVAFQEGNIDVINDLAYITENKKIKLYSLDNKQITKQGYDNIWVIREDVFLVENGEKKGWIDIEGNEIFEPIYDEIRSTERRGRGKYRKQEPDSPTFIELTKDNKKGLANNDYKIILPCEYEDIDLYALQTQNYIVVSKNGLKGAVDYEGKMVIPMEYENLKSLSKYKKYHVIFKNIILATKNGKKGVIDAQGKSILPALYEQIETYTEEEKNYLIAYQGNKHEAFETNGKPVFSETWQAIKKANNEVFNGGRWVKKKDKWGCVSPLGKLIIPFEYKEVGEFTNFINGNRYAKAQKGKRWGLIDEQGREIVPFQYEQINDLQNFQNSTITIKRKGKTEKIEFTDKYKQERNHRKTEAPKEIEEIPEPIKEED
jgi:hypothetical protein